MAQWEAPQENYRKNGRRKKYSGSLHEADPLFYTNVNKCLQIIQIKNWATKFDAPRKIIKE